MQYLGLNKEKKKMLRPSEKFKNIFNFEWDDNEGNFLNEISILNFKMISFWNANLFFLKNFLYLIKIKIKKFIKKIHTFKKNYLNIIFKILLII